MQIEGLVVIAAVAAGTIGFIVLDPLTPRYTLTIDSYMYGGPICHGNITYSPGDVIYSGSPGPSFKVGTVVTLTVHLSPSSFGFHWEGPDRFSVHTVVENQTYTINMTKNMNISVDWFCP